jgi:hypothetical protein
MGAERKNLPEVTMPINVSKTFLKCYRNPGKEDGKKLS